MVFLETPATARKLLPGGAAMARAVGDAAGLGFDFDLDLDGAVRFLSGLWELVVAKAAELAGLLASKADELFPPETRSETLRHWLRVAVTVVLPAALAALLLLCLLRCCYRCCCCCCASVGAYFLWPVAAATAGATMNAPGAAGFVISRPAFLANPQLYFQIARTAGAAAAAAAFSVATL